jgi:outer membrane protein
MKKGNERAWIFILALFPAMAFAQQQPVRATTDTAKIQVHEFSVNQAVDYANKNSATVKNALLDVLRQQEVNREITSNAYPHINANLGTTYNPNVATQVLPNFIGPATYQVLVDEGVTNGSGNPIVMPSDFGFISAQFGTKYSAIAGISLSQILFDGQVFVGLQARAATIRFSKLNAEITEENIKANIHKVYYQLVASKTQLGLLDANISLLEKLLRDTRLLYENGFAEKLDIDKVNVQLNNLRTDRNRVLNTVSNGYYGLKVLLGMPVHDALVLTDTLTEQQIKADILTNSMYDYEDRAEYKYAETGKELNQYNVKRYKLSQLPTVSLNGNYAKNAQRDKWNFFGKGEWFTISSVNLNIAIPIFNGFFTKAKIAQAKIDLQKSENNVNALKRTIDNEVVSARNNFISAIATIESQKENMQLAENVYNQTKKKYEMGMSRQDEINVAQRDLQVAQNNYITALYDAIIARVDFLKATGKL